VCPPNVFDPIFDEDVSRQERYGYKCSRARLGYQAGCERLGLSLWEVEPGSEGIPHYHFANEELLAVLAGRPSLLTPGDCRQLGEGEMAAFPRGPDGLHAIANRTEAPVRVLFFSEMRGPDVLMYPEAGVLGAVERMSSPERGGMATWVRLEGALEHHDAEEPDGARSPAATPDRANLFEPEFDTEHDRPGFTYRRARLGRQAGAERLGASLYELAPGQAQWPMHYHLGNEELLIVIRGRPMLRTRGGERELGEGEVVALPVGERGAHQVVNRTDEPVRVLIVSEMTGPDIVVRPESGKLSAFGRAPGSPDDEGEHWVFFERDQVGFWDREEPPSD
jgi:uncharacterized cupin superfamily protein